MSDERFSIESLAEENEYFLTQFTVDPSTPGYRTKEEAEATIRNQYPDEIIRFHYGDLELGGLRVSSSYYGAETAEANVAKESFGGAAFCKRKA